MVHIIDIDGLALMPTTNYKKVRKLLKSNKAKVVKQNPYTIQLLYKVEDSIRPTLLEGTYMSLVISNDKRFPVGLAPLDSSFICTKEFVESYANSKDKFKAEEIYVDVDSINDFVYDKLVSLNTKLHFFRYESKPFIKYPVTIINEDLTALRKQELNVKLSSNIVIEDGPIAIIGRTGSGKSVLLDNIKTQLEKRGVEVEMLSILNILKDENGITDDPVEINKRITNTILNYKSEINNRLNAIMKAKSNSPETVRTIYDVKDDCYNSKAILIDEFDLMLRPYIDDTCILEFNDLLRYLHNTGFTVIIAAQDIPYSVLQKFSNKIIVGESNAEMTCKIFNKNINLSADIGSGFYFTENSDKIHIFNVDKVKTY